MNCPNCLTISCYVCRQVIDGYDHFGSVSHDAVTLRNSNDLFIHQGSSKKKCVLWDEIEKRHADEVYSLINHCRLNHSRRSSMQVELAAKKAIEELQREGKMKPPKLDTGEKKFRSNKFRLFSTMFRKFRTRKIVAA